MKWFKHDSDASIDSKLQSLLLDYGATGYGLYWYCIELIAQGVNENNITFELEHDARIIARNLNLSHQECKDMMKYMIDLGLFSLNNEKLVCYALAKRLDQSMTSSPKMRNIISQIKENHDPVMTKSCKNRIEEIREDKNRIEEIREENIVDEKFELANKTISYLNQQAKKRFNSGKGNLKEILAQINKLLKQGDSLKTIEDKFAYVINVKCQEWLNNQDMNKYLTPQTLFRESNFDKYLNQEMKLNTNDLVDEIQKARQNAR